MGNYDLLSDPDVFASTLLVVAVDSFGPGILGDEDTPAWSPQTVRDQFKISFGVELTDSNLGKVMAAITVMTSDALFRSLPSFLFVVHGLLGDGTDWSYGEPIDLTRLSWAVTEGLMLWPPDQYALFDPQIIAYCRTIIKREGFLSPPSPLVFAREESAYGDIGAFGEDILLEQSSRTNEINEELEKTQEELMEQLASLQGLNLSSTALSDAIRAEMLLLSQHDKWE